MSTQVADTFATSGRGSPNAWSPASTGWNWLALAGTTPLQFSSATQQGQLSGDISANVVALGTKLYYYTNVLASLAKAESVLSTIGVLARVVNANTYYQASYTNGVLSLIVCYGGIGITLGTYTFTEAPPLTGNATYQLRLQVSGQITNTVSAKLWLVGDPEPSAFQITATDSHIPLPGLVGVFGQCASAQETLTYSAFSAKDTTGYPTQFGSNPYGVNLVNNPGSDPVGIQMLRDAINAGYTWMRWQFNWSDIEKTPPTNGVPNYTWTALDNVVAACNAVGMNLHFCIRSAPAWHSTNPCNTHTTVLMNPPDAAVFAHDLLMHYNLGAAGSFQGWEWGNEDYSKGLNKCPTGDIAASLMAAVYPVAKSLAPALPVGGPATYIERNLTPWWYAAFFAAGGGSHIDFLNMHTYPCPYGPYDVNSAGFTQLQLIQLLTATAAASGFGSLPIWITENAWAVTNSSCVVASGQVQSTNYQGMLDICRTSGLVQRHFWFDIGAITTGQDATEHYRPAYDMIQGYQPLYPSWNPAPSLTTITVPVRGGTTTTTVRSGITEASVRSGITETRIRSGQTSASVRSGDICTDCT